MFNINLSLRVKLLLLFLVIAVTPVIVTGLVAIQLTSNLAFQQVITTQQSKLENLGIEIERFLDTTLSDLRILAGSGTMTNLATAIAEGESLRLQVLRGALEDELVNFMAQRQLSGDLVYDHVRFLNPNGFEFVRIDSVDGAVRAARGSTLNTRANESYFRDALTLEVGDILVSPIEIFDEFGRIPTPYRPVLRYSTPIIAGDTLVGVLITDVRAEGFLNIVSNSVSPDDEVFMVDQSGTYLSHPNPDLLFGEVLGTNATIAQTQPELSFVLDGTNAAYRDLSDNRSAFYRTIAPEGALFRWVLVSQPTAGYLSALTEQTTTVLITAVLVVMVLVAMASLFVSRSISRPIVNLTQVAQSITSGKYDQRVTISNSDEIGTLQSSVNTMAAQIKQAIETLEDRVSERTVQLDAARQVAESASSAKSEFLSNMSHELRTPLNMVIGYTSSMLTMPQMYDYIDLPEIYRKDIAIIQGNGQHLLGLITDILDLSKIEAGKIDLQLQPINLNEIFRGVIATAIGLVKDKPLQLRPNFADDLPPAWGDPLRIRQVLLNLLSNAIKFTQSGTVAVSAHTESGCFMIAVSDTGMGIPQESLGVIFDRFAQIQNNITIQGTGLGLDICQRLVQMHGGELTVESVVGKGSTFRFTLPVASAEQLTAFALPAKTSELNRLQVGGSPSEKLADTQPEPIDWSAFRTILLVVEDSFLRGTLHRILETASYVVFETNQAAEIREFATSLSVDAILLDDDISAKAGFDVLDDLQTHPTTQAIPVVLLTASDNPASLKDNPLSSNTVPRVLKKPFQAEKMLTALQKLLGQSHPEKG